MFIIILLETNIYEYQSSFLPKYSTIHQLLELYNSILNSLEKSI
jgi:hypothetical protein